MATQKRFGWLLACAVVFLTACGGGEPTPYGAIAYNPDSMESAVVVGHISQSEANSDALRECPGGGCQIVLQFEGRNRCGSLMIAANKAWGAASGDTKKAADDRAYQLCINNGGGVCYLHPWPSAANSQCN